MMLGGIGLLATVVVILGYTLGRPDAASEPEAAAESPSPAATDWRPAPDETPEMAMHRYWKAGETLPMELAAHFPIPPLEVKDDTGINVLIDQAHQCLFVTMWELPRWLHDAGLRSMVSHASLDTVLTPGQPSRMRLTAGQTAEGNRLRPFGWVPNPAFNLIITYRDQVDSQSYLEGEREAVRAFVEQGGGIVIIENGVGETDRDRLQQWADQSLATEFGVDFNAYLNGTNPSLLGAEWSVTAVNDNGEALVARRRVGEGRVVLLTDLEKIRWNNDTPASETAFRQRMLRDMVMWAAEGRAPVGGEARLSQTEYGGGGIYPELEERLPGAVVYYAANQKDTILEAVRTELPKISDLLYEWFPSPVSEEPMHIIVAAGDGGGWAVNAFYPKENGLISLDIQTMYGIFAHELAHTMAGPRGASGKTAGNWFDGNQGEAHAGWWQGKILAHYSDNPSMRDCNNLFKDDPTLTEVDLALGHEAKAKWGDYKVWTKFWWIWQKLDDRYGTTWYPRWRWVQYTRWQHDEGRQLTMDEMVEDMSIACGEDLFPFFKSIGTTLRRDRLETIGFQGATLKLPVAKLEVTPAGNARLDPIGDYTKPLPIPET